MGELRSPTPPSTVTIMSYPIYTTHTGPIILIGYGSIGHGLLPLLLRHLAFSPAALTIIDPALGDESVALKAAGYSVYETALTEENYVSFLTERAAQSDQQALIINLATEVSSRALIELAHALNALYIDTVVEPWPGLYGNEAVSDAMKTNYQLREALYTLKTELGQSGPTAVSCCGANPGMVSWLVKEALLKIAHDIGYNLEKTPGTQHAWAVLMADLGVKGVHIAERDSQIPLAQFPETTFTNTWSVDGLIAEALQPAELGWGTNEAMLPNDAKTHQNGNGSAIYLQSRGAETQVQTWVPQSGAILSFLVTHNEAISISDYFSVYDADGTLQYRPTCHYAYHPSDRTVMCLKQLATEGSKYFKAQHVLRVDEIKDGSDELGVLLYGHAKNAYWYGTRLAHHTVPTLAPAQNATGLQVSSAVLAGIVWLLHNRNEGIIEAEAMDHAFCLAIQKPYLGEVFGVYTDWYPEPKQHPDPWQFSNTRL